jgi:hypothetical protein
MAGPRAGVVVDDRGTAHWLYRSETRFYTLDVSFNAARVSLAKVPILVEAEHERRLMQTQPPFPCITQGGKLSFFSVRQPAGDMLKFCTKRDQDDDNKAGWRRYQLPMSLHTLQPFIQTRRAGALRRARLPVVLVFVAQCVVLYVFWVSRLS